MPARCTTIITLVLLLAGCGGGEEHASRKADPLPNETARLFAFERDVPLEAKEGVTARQRAFVAKEISYASPGGDRVSGIVVRPTKRAASYAGVIYMHGAGGSRIDFLPEAAELAVRGAVTITIDSPSSRSANPQTRAGRVDVPTARRLTIQNAQDLVRGLDVLVRNYGADPERLAIVGYSMGVQAAALAAALDARVSAVVLMAGRAYPSRTPGVPAWERGLGPLDTVHFVGHLAPARVLLQGGRDDQVIGRLELEMLYAATSEPKEIRWYKSGHELTARADTERLDWLSDGLGLR